MHCKSQKDNLSQLKPEKGIYSKCITDLNVRPKAIQFLEEHIGGNLYDFGLSNDFLDKTPKV